MPRKEVVWLRWRSRRLSESLEQCGEEEEAREDQLDEFCDLLAPSAGPIPSLQRLNEMCHMQDHCSYVDFIQLYCKVLSERARVRYNHRTPNLAQAYFDRVMLQEHWENWVLLAVGCVMLAIKMEEQSQPQTEDIIDQLKTLFPPTESFDYITPDLLQRTEIEIVDKLHYMLHIKTVWDYLSCLVDTMIAFKDLRLPDLALLASELPDPPEINGESWDRPFHYTRLLCECAPPRRYIQELARMIEDKTAPEQTRTKWWKSLESIPFSTTYALDEDVLSNVCPRLHDSTLTDPRFLAFPPAASAISCFVAAGILHRFKDNMPEMKRVVESLRLESAKWGGVNSSEAYTEVGCCIPACVLLYLEVEEATLNSHDQIPAVVNGNGNGSISEVAEVETDDDQPDEYVQHVIDRVNEDPSLRGGIEAWGEYLHENEGIPVQEFWLSSTMKAKDMHHNAHILSSIVPESNDLFLQGLALHLMYLLQQQQ
eukprot:Sspe_Gene.69359::Locus_40885_Transcript_1_1_Confidence_1.000_Length_1879::g.69359::m.69359